MRATRSAPAKDVDEYLAALPEEARVTLGRLRKLTKSVVPDVAEVISYRMPVFKYKGRPLIGFAAFKDHCSFFPMSPSVMEAHKDELEAYDTSKGTIRFPFGKPLPAGLVKKLVKARIEEIEAGLKGYRRRVRAEVRTTK